MKSLFSILSLVLMSLFITPMFGLSAEIGLSIVAVLAVSSYLMPKQVGVAFSTLPVQVWDALNATIIKRNPDNYTVPSFFEKFSSEWNKVRD